VHFLEQAIKGLQRDTTVEIAHAIKVPQLALDLGVLALHGRLE